MPIALQTQHISLVHGLLQSTSEFVHLGLLHVTLPSSTHYEHLCRTHMHDQTINNSLVTFTHTVLFFPETQTNRLDLLAHLKFRETDIRG